MVYARVIIFFHHFSVFKFIFIPSAKGPISKYCHTGNKDLILEFWGDTDYKIINK